MTTPIANPAAPAADATIAAAAPAVAPAPTSAAAAPPAAPAPPAPPAAKPAPRALARKAAPAAAAPATPATPAVDASPKREGIGSRAVSALRNQLDAARKDAGEAKALRDELAQYAKKELEGAPEEARKYVSAKYKDDPRAQLAALRELREAGLLKATAVATGPAANTAPPRAPVADSTDPDVSAALQHKALADNPATYLVATAFHSKNAAAIKRGQQKLASKN